MINSRMLITALPTDPTTGISRTAKKLSPSESIASVAEEVFQNLSRNALIIIEHPSRQSDIRPWIARWIRNQ